jgi:hypothetical protein
MSSKRHSKRIRKTKASPKRRFPPWLWLAVGGAVLLIIGGLSLVWTSSEAGVVTLDVTPEVAGAPRLAVDQEVIDEGYIKLNNTIRTTFRLRNVGDEPLHILGEPAVELVEGC